MERLIKLVNKIITKGLEPFGIYYSFYGAIVIDNDDPENLNRLKVAVPGIYGEKVYPDWVQPRAVFSGVNYGMQVLPQKGDVIQITFSFGNPKYPRWEVGYFGLDKDKKSEIQDGELKKKNSYWFKTPKGLVVSLDDDKGTVTIKHKSGACFRLSENSIDLVIGSGKLINLGTFDKASEPALLGDHWEDMMGNLLDSISAITVNTAFGPSTTPNNIADFVNLKGELVNVKSIKVKLD